MYNLAISYMDNKKYDSSNLYIEKGLNESDLFKNNEYKSKFLFIKGTNTYYQNNYNKCTEIIDSIIPLFEDDNQIMVLGHIYMGKSYFKLGNKDLGVNHLLIADSLFVNSGYQTEKKIRESYKLLSDYYKEKNDYHNQLRFVEKLIKTDSIDKSYFVGINNTIKRDYEIPRLLEEKSEIIKEIQLKENKSKIYIYLLMILVAVLLLIIIWYSKKQNVYKKKFVKLMDEQQHQEQQKVKDNNELNIPKDIVQNVINNLIELEKNKFYLDRNVNLQDLSKQLETNSNYLSKIINHYKGRNFSTYINELRINEAIERLKKDKQFQKYTIQAIAHESGFKSHQSFSKSFYKIKGITPSYFLKELQKVKI